MVSFFFKKIKNNKKKKKKNFLRWAPNEQTVPIKCTEPVSRCQGGRGSPCSEGYLGYMCSTCETGYYNAQGACQKCTNGSIFLINF